VVATSADGELAQTAYYNEILRRLDAHHVLYGIVREQGAALGQLSLYRAADAPAFSPRERADLASVIRYVAHGVAGDEARPQARTAAMPSRSRGRGDAGDGPHGARSATAPRRRGACCSSPPPPRSIPRAFAPR
jgi:hypothetical protein